MSEMRGKFLGGGELDYVIQNGEIYVHAGELSYLFGDVGVSNTIKAAVIGDESLLIGAQLLLGQSKQFADLRSELLLQEAEKSLTDLGDDLL